MHPASSSLKMRRHKSVLLRSVASQTFEIYVRSGLLAYGSIYRPRLPAGLEFGSGFLRLSSPLTAAGPRRFLTVFPDALSGFRTPVFMRSYYNNSHPCQGEKHFGLLGGPACNNFAHFTRIRLFFWSWRLHWWYIMRLTDPNLDYVHNLPIKIDRLTCCVFSTDKRQTLLQQKS